VDTKHDYNGETMNENKYDEIIELPHYVSRKRPKMSLYNRAAQFSPFAALSGHSDAIIETARLTENKHDVDDSIKELISEKLRILLSLKDESPEVTVKFFVKDELKCGGAYETITGEIRLINPDEKEIVICDGRHIKIDCIYSIEGQIFENFGF